MNAYAQLLDRLTHGQLHDDESRRALYQRAREILGAHLLEGEAATPEEREAEMKRLDDAIAFVEGAREGDGGRPGGPDRPGGEVPPAAAPLAADAVAPGPSRLGPRPTIAVALSRLLRLASNPYFLIASLVAGVYVGLYSKTLTAAFTPVADVYIELLKMVLIPFMMSAIVVSLSRLFGTEAMRRRIGAILGTFVVGLALSSATGILVCAVASPGTITGTARKVLGQVVNHSIYAVDLEITLRSPGGGGAAASRGLIAQIVPDNIFKAMTAGENLKILFFAIVFGVALGSLQALRGESLRAALLSVYDVCTKMITWVNALLPVALCGMVAKQVASVGAAELVAMIRFTVGFAAAASLVISLSVLLMAWASGTGLLRTMRAAREPLLLAVATRSSVTCIPSATDALAAGLGYGRDDVEALLPLGITLFRFGPVLYYAFTTIFVAQLYGVSLAPGAYAVALGGAVLTGLASAGTSGVLTISLLGVIFQPLGLPLEAALTLLVTVDPVVDIFRTACIVIPNCAAVAVVYRGRKSGGPQSVPDPSRTSASEAYGSAEGFAAPVPAGLPGVRPTGSAAS